MQFTWERANERTCVSKRAQAPTHIQIAQWGGNCAVRYCWIRMSEWVRSSKYYDLKSYAFMYSNFVKCCNFVKCDYLQATYLWFEYYTCLFFFLVCKVQLVYLPFKSRTLPNLDDVNYSLWHVSPAWKNVQLKLCWCNQISWRTSILMSPRFYAENLFRRTFAANYTIEYEKRHFSKNNSKSSSNCDMCNCYLNNKIEFYEILYNESKGSALIGQFISFSSKCRPFNIDNLYVEIAERAFTKIVWVVFEMSTICLSRLPIGL